MLKVAFSSPAEPTWDFKVCAAPRSNGHFASGGWLPIGVPSVITWNRPTTRPARFRPAGRAERFLFLLLREVLCFGFQRVAGAKPPPAAGGFTATDSPDSPTNSSEEPMSVLRHDEIYRSDVVWALRRDSASASPCRKESVRAVVMLDGYKGKANGERKRSHVPRSPSAMSPGPAIPWRVALQQSPPPLYRPESMLHPPAETVNHHLLGARDFSTGVDNLTYVVDRIP